MSEHNAVFLSQTSSQTEIKGPSLRAQQLWHSLARRPWPPLALVPSSAKWALEASGAGLKLLCQLSVPLESDLTLLSLSLLAEEWGS